MADLTEHREAATRVLTRFMRPADAIGTADLIVAALGPRLHTLHCAEERLTKLVGALATVIADMDEGDQLCAGDLLAEIRRAGDDVHAPLVAAVEETAALRTADAVGAWS